MRKKYFILLLLSVILCSSCVETIYPESVEEAPIVVNCVLDTSDTQSLYLAFSSKVGDADNFTVIDNADVVLREITAGDTLTVATFSFESDGMWRTKFRPVPKKKYQLMIDVPGRKRITATTSMPDVIKVYWHIYSAISGNIESHDSHYPGTSYFANFTNHTIYLYMSGKDDEGNAVIANEIATDHLFEDLVNITGTLFFMSKPDYTPHFFFLEPVWYPTVNGRALHKKHIRIPDPDKYVNPLRKNDTTITKGKFTVATPDTVGKHINKLNILQVSHELDLYFKSVLTEQCKHDVSDNFLIVYDRTNIYGNVTNALGIFGAYNKYVLPWFLRESDLWTMENECL